MSTDAPTQSAAQSAQSSGGWTLTTLWNWIYYALVSPIHSGLPIIFWQRPRWFTSEMGDKDGEVIFITGGNSGTGYETAKAYYEHGAKVYIGCRSEQRARDAIAEIKKGGSKDIADKWVYKPLADPGMAGSIEFIQLDLSDLESVDRAAKEFLAREQRLDVLFGNAGIMAVPPGEYTKQGYPLQFGTNVLGHQRLIQHFIPLMRATSHANPAHPSRLIMLSSAGHGLAPLNGGIDYASLQRHAKHIGAWAEYGESKWGDIALAKYVDRHYGPRSEGAMTGEIVAIAVHPGLIASNLGRHISYFAWAYDFPSLIDLWQVTPSIGALNQIWAAECPTPEAEKLSGKYIACYQQESPIRPDLDDPNKVEMLWAWCESQAYECGLKSTNSM